MNYRDYEPAYDHEAREWLENKIPELTPYQKEKMRDEDFFRFESFKIFKERERIKNPFIRLSIIFFPIVWFIFLCGLPFNFLITGKWGYGSIEWFTRWMDSLGL